MISARNSDLCLPQPAHMLDLTSHWGCCMTWLNSGSTGKTFIRNKLAWTFSVILYCFRMPSDSFQFQKWCVWTRVSFCILLESSSLYPKWWKTGLYLCSVSLAHPWSQQLVQAEWLFVPNNLSICPSTSASLPFFLSSGFTINTVFVMFGSNQSFILQIKETNMLWFFFTAQCRQSMNRLVCTELRNVKFNYLQAF